MNIRLETSLDLNSIFDISNEKNSIENIRIIKPNYYYRAIDKVTKLIFSNEITYNEPLEITMGKNVTTKIMINRDDRQRMDEFDYCVYCAICTLYEVGNTVMSYKSIIELLSGKNYISKLSDKIFNDVSVSIEKLMSTVITLDVTNEISEHNRLFSNNKFRENLVQITTLESSKYRIRGQVSRGLIKINKEPFLYKLSKERKQVDTIDLYLLNASISITKNNIMLIHYLNTRIKLNHKKRESSSNYNLIKLNHIYNLLGIKDKSLKNRKRKDIDKILCVWKENKLINDYTYIISKKGEKENIKIF